MNTLNRSLALFVALLISFALVACGTTKAQTNGANTDPSATTEEGSQNMKKVPEKKQEGGNMERGAMMDE